MKTITMEAPCEFVKDVENILIDKRKAAETKKMFECEEFNLHLKDTRSDATYYIFNCQIQEIKVDCQFFIERGFTEEQQIITMDNLRKRGFADPHVITFEKKTISRL